MTRVMYLPIFALGYFVLQCKAMAARRVFVSGAGGQTGQLVFRKLLAMEGWEPVGAVRSEASRKVLIDSGVPESCVVVCDVTDPQSCQRALEGCDAAVICTSAKPAPTGETNPETGRPIFGFPNGQPELVDWIGQKNQIDAAKAQGPGCHVVICSSMGGTNPNHPLNNLGKVTLADGTTQGGDILKWKRKAEVYLMESGLPYTIVHPGGLLNEVGGKRELCLGVDDKVPSTTNNSIPREDVAQVLVQSLLNEKYRGRSFDLVSKPEGEGSITDDFDALLETLGGKNCDYTLGAVA